MYGDRSYLRSNPALLYRKRNLSWLIGDFLNGTACRSHLKCVLISSKLIAFRSSFFLNLIGALYQHTRGYRTIRSCSKFKGATVRFSYCKYSILQRCRTIFINLDKFDFACKITACATATFSRLVRCNYFFLLLVRIKLHMILEYCTRNIRSSIYESVLVARISQTKRKRRHIC